MYVCALLQYSLYIITHQNGSFNHNSTQTIAKCNDQSQFWWWLICFWWLFFVAQFCSILSRHIEWVGLLTKSLCKSLLRNGDIFTAPMNMKNNPNRMDRLLSTTDELTLFWLSDPAGGGWAFCGFCGGDGVIAVRFLIYLSAIAFWG